MTYGHDLIVTLIQTKQCPIHNHDQEVQQVTYLHESEGCYITINKTGNLGMFERAVNF